MPNFEYSAVRNDGERISGVMEGADRAAILLRLSRQGHHPIDVSEADSSTLAKTFPGFGRKLPSFSDISLFTRELSWLLNAGLSLSNGLEILAKESFSTDFSAMISSVRVGIRKGHSLHEALQETGAFPAHYVSMVEIGEASGTLAAVLGRVANSRDREQRIRHRIVSALVYPSLLVTLAVGAISFIMVFVVPKLKDMITGSGAPIPEPAQIVIGVSDWLIDNGFTLITLGPASLLLLALLIGTARLKRVASAISYHLPLIGTMMKRAIVLRFCRMLGTLLWAGVSLPESLKLIRSSLGNKEIESVIGRMEVSLRQGDDFLVPVEQSRLFPKLVARMLRVGNETGNLTPSILQVTEILEEKFDQVVDRTLTLLEPAIILTLSMIVALIIVSLMSAIISINDLAI
jgi:general secretion pathway protein F